MCHSVCIFLTRTVAKWNSSLHSAARLSPMSAALPAPLLTSSIQEIRCCALSPSREAFYCEESELRSMMRSWGRGKCSAAQRRITWSGPQPQSPQWVRRKVKHLHFKIKHQDAWKQSTFLFHRFSPLPSVPMSRTLKTAPSFFKLHTIRPLAVAK